MRTVEFNGRLFVDVRVFVNKDATGERVPTKKGVAIRPDKLGEIIEALKVAQGHLPSDEDVHEPNILAAG